MYLTFSSASKDIGDANHGNAGKVKSKFHGEYDAVVQKYPLNAIMKEMQGNDLDARGDITTKPLMEVYPMPFDQGFTVKLQEEVAGVADWKLFSVTGECMGNIVPHKDDALHVSYDCAPLRSGVYILRYADSKKVIITKLIKQ